MEMIRDNISVEEQTKIYSNVSDYSATIINLNSDDNESLIDIDKKIYVHSFEIPKWKCFQCQCLIIQ